MAHTRSRTKLYVGLVTATLVMSLPFWTSVTRAADCGEQPPSSCPAPSIWICRDGVWFCGEAAANAIQNPLGTVTIWQLFSRVAGGLNFATGAMALFFIVLGGYRILTAGGNSEHFQKGRQMITYALLGLVLTVGSYSILATTISVLTGKDGPPKFSTETVLIDPLNLRNDSRPAGYVFFGERILGFILSGLAGLSILMFVYGGTLWLTSAGNEERIGSAKKTLLYATIGLVVVLSSYIFVSFVYGPFYKILTSS